MVRREVADCDRCGAKEPAQIQQVIADHPRKPGDMDAFQSSYDLCPACMAQLLTKRLYGDSEEQARVFIGGRLARA